MDLSEDIVKGLGLLSARKTADGSTALSDSAFERLANATFDILLRRSAEDVLDALAREVDPLVIKQAYAGLVGFVVEGAKINADPLFIQGVLQEHQLKASRIDFITGLYDTNKPELIALLATTTFNYPHLVDLDWRLDFYIRNNSVDKVNLPQYLIKLHTLESHSADDEQGGAALKKGSVEFACSATELLALHKKLQDACKQFERITGAT